MSKVVPKYYDSKGPGKKQCPGCNKIVGGVLKTCYCGFDFVSAKKEREEAASQEKKDKELARNEAPKVKMSAKTAEMLAFLKKHPYKAPVALSKKDHAERILAYGKKRAKLLLQQHDSRKNWVHVDWEYVRERLAA